VFVQVITTGAEALQIEPSSMPIRGVSLPDQASLRIEFSTELFCC